MHAAPLRHGARHGDECLRHHLPAKHVPTGLGERGSLKCVFGPIDLPEFEKIEEAAGHGFWLWNRHAPIVTKSA